MYRARVKPPAALPDEAAFPDDVTESDIVAWVRELRKDLVAPDAPLAGVEVEAAPLMRALFVAQGWVIERGTPAQWHEARNSETNLGAYADSVTPATPELVARAGEFHSTQNGKGKGWRLSYLEQDWPQLYRWLKRSRTPDNGKVEAAPTKPAGQAVAVVEAPQRRDAAFWEPVLQALQ